MSKHDVFLILDSSWRPHQWADYQVAVGYEYDGQVVARLGEEVRIYHGGTNAKTGLRSEIVTSTILVLKNGPSHKKWRAPMLTNRSLFVRDMYVCGYCGGKFSGAQLTRDHIVPRCHGGQDIWTNVVTACKECNNLKDDVMPGKRLPYGQLGPQGDGFMNPLYVPYVPCPAENFILRERKVLACQMAFLLSRIENPQSRIFETVDSLHHDGYFKNIPADVKPSDLRNMDVIA